MRMIIESVFWNYVESFGLKFLSQIYHSCLIAERKLFKRRLSKGLIE